MTFYLRQGYTRRIVCGEKTVSKHFGKELENMIFVGIDVAKRKHDCCIINSEGEVLREPFTFPNSREGFDAFYDEVQNSQMETGDSKIRIGLESTGQYSRNLMEYLLSKRLNPVLLNPFASDSFRKARTLRKTKTDKTDARLIASMLVAETLKPYVKPSYHIEALKSLARARYRLVQERAKLKTSLVRLLDTLFPELDGAVYSLHQKSTLALLSAFPSAKAIANAHLTRLTNILAENSRGRYGRDKAIEIRELAKTSIASGGDAQSFELLSVIRHIAFVQSEIKILDGQIKDIIDGLGSPIFSVPGISYTLAAIILGEIGDIGLFSSPGKLLAFAGLEPSTYQSGNYTASHSRMVKRGSKYLRWALLQAAERVRIRDKAFGAVYSKKIGEGKHHYVAVSHVAKKLVRVIHHLLSSGTVFVPQQG